MLIFPIHSFQLVWFVLKKTGVEYDGYCEFWTDHMELRTQYSDSEEGNRTLFLHQILRATGFGAGFVQIFNLAWNLRK